jgi:hypothetical protein
MTLPVLSVFFSRSPRQIIGKAVDGFANALAVNYDAD